MVLNNVTKFHKILIKSVLLRERTSFQIDFFLHVLFLMRKTEMVLGKRWLFSIGNGAEIRPLEKGRKSPGRYVTPTRDIM